jgi:DNA-binding beta-propeller fold protein YncE
MYVASESDDEVTVLRYEPAEGLSVEKVVRVGRWPAETEGPHGLFFDPTGRYWYLTLGHGYPNGTLLKFDARADTVVGSSDLGLFPATVSLTPEGALAFIVNSNFYGDHVPSTVSIVDTETMYEIEQATTCTMPHGSRMSPDGMRHYSACMMDDQLVEMSTQSLAVTRRLDLVSGQPVETEEAAHAMDMDTGARSAACSPTWTTPAADGRRLYVACNRGNEIVEVDLESWRVTRRIPAEGAPYNLALTPDGSRLLATLKGSAHLAAWDLETGELLGTVESLQRVTHGVVVSRDGRYAFVTVEGVGGEPGLVEVIDLTTLERVASAEVGKQAGGITLAPDSE